MTLARSAAAQEAPSPSAAPAPPSASTTAPPASNLEERLDEVDQRSRIALRKLELAEEAAAAREKAAKEKEKAQASVKISDRGFSITSADGAHSISLRALIQADARIFVNDEHQLVDTLVLRRARPIFDATMGKNFTVRIMPDFGSGQTVLLDAYIDARAADEFGVGVGKFKPYVGLERLQPVQSTYFVERGYPSSVAPNRDVGVAVFGDLFGGKLGYQVGFFNGVVDGGTGSDLDFDDSKEFTAHIYARPFATQARFTRTRFVQGLFLGVAATRGEKTGTPANPYLPVFRTVGQNAFFRYLADTSTNGATGATGGTAVAAGVQNRLTGHIYAPIGPFALLGEYIVSQQRVARGAVSKLVTLQAWNITAAWAVTGEEAKFEGIEPKHPLDLSKGHLGAIELAARYSGMIIDRDAYNDLALDTRSARLAAEFGGGINWYPTRNYRVTGDYFVTEFRSGGATAAGGRRDLEQVFLLRNQIAF